MVPYPRFRNRTGHQQQQWVYFHQRVQDRADAHARVDCPILATTQSLGSFWMEYLPQYNVPVQKPGVEVFGGQVDTA